MNLESVILRGTRAGQPAANTVPAGSLYYVTDEFKTERSTGAAWQDYTDMAAAGITQLTGDVTAGPGSGSQAASIGANKVVTAKILDANVTYAKIQNISATARALGRKTAGAGVTEELTLSELLDFVGSAARGDIFYRGAATWTRLPAGTSGQYLQTLGAGADPAWATVAAGSAAWTLITSGSPTLVNKVDVTGLSGYTDIRVLLLGLATSGGASEPLLRVSTDNGVSFLSAVSDYKGIKGNGTEQNSANGALEFCSNSTTAGLSGEIFIEGFNLAYPHLCRANFFSADAINMQYVPTLTVLNAIRILSSSAGNFTSGTYYVFGR
jgi:hypothetical protein